MFFALKAIALIEDAELCMQSGRGEITKAILEEILTNTEYDNCVERVNAMQMKGKYQLDTNSKCFEAVSCKYFDGSLVLLEKIEQLKESQQDNEDIITLPFQTFAEFERKSKCGAYELIGKYADREYSQVTSNWSLSFYSLPI